MTPLTSMHAISPLLSANTFANNNYTVNNNYTNGFMTNVPYFLQTSASSSSTLTLPFKQFTHTMANNDHTSSHANEIVPQVIYEHCPNNE